MIKQILLPNGYDSNFCYFICDGKSRDIAIVDPDDIDTLESIIDIEGWKPKAIWLTHSHFDHIGGVMPLINKYELPVFMHELAVNRLDVPQLYIRKLIDGDNVKIGELEFKVIHTPGHIDNAVCYFDPLHHELITGDTLFVEGCGHTRDKTGSCDQLWYSLQKLKELPNQTIIYPGHNYGCEPTSTLELEKERNKFLVCNKKSEFIKLRA